MFQPVRLVLQTGQYHKMAAKGGEGRGQGGTEMR